ncbi:hypothetical protein HZC31_04450 [Candidatus Woesearchaeota archaeon]|nr:hypothetical protein [Candidatus Woesearchaeota archaeon]
MSGYNESNSGWAMFGKATVWVVGLGALGTGLYFGGNSLYQEGVSDGRNTTLRETSAAYEQKQADLVAAGLVLPEKGCLRYKKEVNRDGDPINVISCSGSSATLELRLVNDTFGILTYTQGAVKNTLTPLYGDFLSLNRYVTKIEQVK